MFENGVAPHIDVENNVTSHMLMEHDVITCLKMTSMNRIKSSNLTGSEWDDADHSFSCACLMHSLIHNFVKIKCYIKQH